MIELAHRIPGASGFGLLVETNDDIVGVTYDDHATRRLAPLPNAQPTGRRHSAGRHWTAVAMPATPAPSPYHLVTPPSSRMPAFNHFWTRWIMRGSLIWQETNLIANSSAAKTKRALPDATLGEHGQLVFYKTALNAIILDRVDRLLSGARLGWVVRKSLRSMKQCAACLASRVS